MATKKNPGKFDCYQKAKDDEPMFTLLARDPQFQKLVEQWADERERAIHCGERPATDVELVAEARQCAKDGADWRRKNNGKWRA